MQYTTCIQRKAFRKSEVYLAVNGELKVFPIQQEQRELCAWCDLASLGEYFQNRILSYF